jgi:hypothetical protein
VCRLPRPTRNRERGEHSRDEYGDEIQKVIV